MNTIRKGEGRSKAPFVSRGGTRTHNLRNTNPALYPVELRVVILISFLVSFDLSMLVYSQKSIDSGTYAIAQTCLDSRNPNTRAHFFKSFTNPEITQPKQFIANHRANEKNGIASKYDVNENTCISRILPRMYSLDIQRGPLIRLTNERRLTPSILCIFAFGCSKTNTNPNHITPLIIAIAEKYGTTNTHSSLRGKRPFCIRAAINMKSEVRAPTTSAVVSFLPFSMSYPPNHVDTFFHPARLSQGGRGINSTPILETGGGSASQDTQNISFSRNT